MTARVATEQYRALADEASQSDLSWGQLDVLAARCAASLRAATDQLEALPTRERIADAIARQTLLSTQDRKVQRATDAVIKLLNGADR